MIKKLGFAGALMVLALSLSGQDSITFTGKIVNSSNDPIPGVTVNYEGSIGNPAITDSTGLFELMIPAPDIWLNITPIGDYDVKRVYLNRLSEITIYLNRKGTESVEDEVVYVGQNKLRKDLVASTELGRAWDKLKNTDESFDQGFQGKIPGSHQVGLSGMPGQGTYMLLRGLTSVNTNNQPLILIDGMPLETPGLVNSIVDGYEFHPLGSVDQLDISSISIIKDGPALSAYGLKGSNGIILVETLKPEETTTSIDFAIKMGMHFFNTEIPQLNSQEYKTLAKEVLSSSNMNEETFQSQYPGLYYTPSDIEFARYGYNTNWQQEVFRDAFLQDYYIAVKGGDAIAKYGLSVGFLNHQGTIENTNFSRFNTRFVGTFNVFNWMKIFVSANLATSNAEYKESGLVRETSPLLTALHKTPQMNPLAYDDEWRQISEVDDVDEIGVSNPSAVSEQYTASNDNYRFLTSLRLEGDISKKLKWITMLGLNIFDVKENVFMPNKGMELYFDDEAHNVSLTQNNLLFTVYNDNYITYQNLFKNIHHLSVSGGFRWQSNDYQEDRGTAMNSSENDQYVNLQSGEVQLRNITGDNGRWNWLAVYLTGSYGYRDKYLLEAAVSADFSSRIGEQASDVLRIGDVPFGIFYSLGAAWRLSNESFLSNAFFLEDLKLRASYGITGNDDIGNLNALKYYQLKIYRETSGMIPGGIPNEYLTFETIQKISAGLDLSLWGNRLMFSGDYYTGTTSDMLIFEQLNSYMGYDIYPSNRASLDKQGYEASLRSRILQSGNFTFDLGMSLAHFESSISSIANNEIITELPGGITVINRVGEPANSFFGYKYNGVYTTSAEAHAEGLVNRRGIPYGAGDARFSDIDGWDDVNKQRTGQSDGIINEFDKVMLGSAAPEYYGGLYTDFSYKRWGLNIFWQFVYGNEVVNYMRYQNEKMTDLSNQSKAVLNRWASEGQVTNIPRSLWDDPIGNSAFSSRWIEDGSYIRMKQVTLSYEIPRKVWVFKNLYLFLTGTNLLTFSDYLSYDPEFSASFDPKMQGIDYGLMPFGKKIMVGVKFGL